MALSGDAPGTGGCLRKLPGERDRQGDLGGPHRSPHPLPAGAYLGLRGRRLPALWLSGAKGQDRVPAEGESTLATNQGIRPPGASPGDLHPAHHHHRPHSRRLPLPGASLRLAKVAGNLRQGTQRHRRLERIRKGPQPPGFGRSGPTPGARDRRPEHLRRHAARRGQLEKACQLRCKGRAKTRKSETPERGHSRLPDRLSRSPPDPRTPGRSHRLISLTVPASPLRLCCAPGRLQQSRIEQECRTEGAYW